jgi:hypothetical protein
MFLKIRQRFFLNDLVIEIQEPQKSSFIVLLRDHNGNFCRSVEMKTETNQSLYKWNGLNELPYGVYTCEILEGIQEMTMQLVKRI